MGSESLNSDIKIEESCLTFNRDVPVPYFDNIDDLGNSFTGKAIDFQFVVKRKPEHGTIKRESDCSLDENIDSTNKTFTGKAIDFQFIVKPKLEHSTIKRESDCSLDENIDSTNKTCVKCEYIGEDFDDLNKHVKSIHSNRDITGDLLPDKRLIHDPSWSKCKYCDKYWPDGNHEVHKKMMSIEKNLMKRRKPYYLCQECNIEIHKFMDIYKHLTIHINTKKSMKLKQPENIKNHKQKKSKCLIQKFECKLCGYITKKKYNLDRHEPRCKKDHKIRQSESYINKCEHCEKFWLDNDHELHKIIMQLRNKQINSQNPYLCDNCNQEFTKVDEVYVHLLEHDDMGLNLSNIPREIENQKTVQEDQTEKPSSEQAPVGFSILRDYLLKDCNEKEDEKKDEKEVVVPVSYECVLCDFIGETVLHLQLHLKIHKIVRPSVCTKCDYKAVSMSSIYKHLNVVHNTIYSCKHCLYTTENRRQYDFHKKLHRDQIYKCPMCPYQARVKYYVDKHYKGVHLKKRSAASTKSSCMCETCGRQFKQISLLKKHKMYHHNNSSETFICHLCGFETTVKLILKAHISRHFRFEEQLMYCANCDYQTHNKSNLIQHMVKHADTSKIKLHKCTICSFETKRPHTLRNHIRDTHDAFK